MNKFYHLVDLVSSDLPMLTNAGKNTSSMLVVLNSYILWESEEH